MKCVFEHQDLQMVGLKLNKYESFHSLEVVDCGSGTQPEVSENLNHITILDG